MGNGAALRATVGAATGLMLLSACAPRFFKLAPERRADTNAEYSTQTFVVTPPAGRWVVDTVQAGVAQTGWPSGYPLSPCGSGLRGTLCLAERLADEPLQGYIFCEAPHMQIMMERADSLAGCILFRAYRLAVRYRGEAGNRLALATLDSTISSLSDTHLGALNLWEGLTRVHPQHPVRGALYAVTIGSHEFHRLAVVFQREPYRLFPSPFGEDVLIELLADRMMVVALQHGWLRPGSAEWNVVASLRWPASR